MTIKDNSRLDDHYSRLARREGYPARSVYKLEEIDRKHRLFQPGRKVLDLGCAPGSWSLYAAEKVGERGLVLGLDLQAPTARAWPPQVSFLKADLLDADFDLAAQFGPFDLLLSDLAPATTGRREVDQARSLDLARAAWAWAGVWLRPGGHFLFKIFQSPEADDFVKKLHDYFRQITLLKPRATRRASQEVFALGLFFKPAEADSEPGPRRRPPRTRCRY